MQPIALLSALLAAAAPATASPPGRGPGGGGPPGHAPGGPPGHGPGGPPGPPPQAYNASTYPTQHRLAFHGADGMTVSWSTLAKIDNPTVRFGPGPGKALVQQASGGESVTFPTSSKYHNHVVLKGLLPGTTYHYRVEGGGSNETFSFTTARAKGDPRPLTIGMFADMGTFGDLGLSDHLPPGVGGALQPGEITTIQRLQMDAQKDKFAFLVGGGDYSYADYWLKEEVLQYLPKNLTDGPEEYDRIDQAFWDEMQPLTANLPLLVSPGNHEANCDNAGYKSFNESLCPVGQTNFTSYKNRFRMPSDVSGGFGSFWFSYEVGQVHFLHYTTETDFTGAPDQQPNSKYNDGPVDPSQPGAQLAFIQSDLAKVDRALTPWVVAVGHRPWYTAVDPGSLCTTCQAAFEKLFVDAGVDMVFSGHVHASTRSGPIAFNVTDPAGLNNPRSPLWLCSGAAGHFDGLDSLQIPAPSYVAYAQNSSYAYSRVTFHNRTHMQHDFVASATGDVLDSAMLYKEHKLV